MLFQFSDTSQEIRDRLWHPGDNSYPGDDADSPYGKTKVMAETILDDLCYDMFLLVVIHSV